MKYTNVIIDNRSNSTDTAYTYACNHDGVQVGSKVLVPFATGKTLREGYVISLTDRESVLEAGLINKLKVVGSVEENISLTEEMVRTAIWMRERYICRYIDAIKCFTPAGAPLKKGERDMDFTGLTEADDETAVGYIDPNEEQQQAIKIISDSIERDQHDRFLIHGVTGSGKTEIYIRAAEKVISLGKGAIILVPEISLTGQITERFAEVFGADNIAVLHSRLSPAERYEQWQRIRRGTVRIVIGARSAVFAPMENIGLIVADEEHETTYKSDHTPKYDTIEVAIKRLQDRDNRGVIILGSATPSVVTYSRSCEGIYKLVRLTRRYNDNPMPQSEIVDMRAELRDGNRSMISRKLASEIREQLEKGRQIILFLNRRGYSTFISCRECGYVANCPTCGLSLTYHRGTAKGSGDLNCHFCGYTCDAITECPECGSGYVRYFGTGTEKVEEAVRKLFSTAVTERVDLDSTRQRGQLRKKLKAFEKGKTDILIGTQLIVKGLDFRNVGLVGIVSADVSLNIPDFRSPEKAFQLITQAAGRAGRGEEEGKVIIQTYNPEHYAVQMSARQDYECFYENEIKFRKYMTYPPYSDIFQVLFTADSAEAAEAGAQSWYERMTGLVQEDERKNIFPPQEAYMSKIRDTYRYSLIIKCPKGKRREYSACLRTIKEEDTKSKPKKKYIAVVDINPYSFV